jgi:hypothetical protein
MPLLELLYIATAFTFAVRRVDYIIASYIKKRLSPMGKWEAVAQFLFAFILFPVVFLFDAFALFFYCIGSFE